MFAVHPIDFHEDYRLVTTRSGPTNRGVMVGCGRWFWSSIRHSPSPRRLAYFEQVVKRHQRRCTRCKKWRRAHQQNPWTDAQAVLGVGANWPVNTLEMHHE